MNASLKLKGVPIAIMAPVTTSDVEAKVGRLGAFPLVAMPLVLTEVLACLKDHLGEAGAARPSGNS